MHIHAVAMNVDNQRMGREKSSEGNLHFCREAEMNRARLLTKLWLALDQLRLCGVQRKETCRHETIVKGAVTGLHGEE